MQPPASRRTWRIRGVPQEFDKNMLIRVLEYHPDLRCANQDPLKDHVNRGNGVRVHTLAPDHLRPHEQVATIRFDSVPFRLQIKRPLLIEIDIIPEDPLFEDQQVQDLFRTAVVAIDEHFEGITTLISPCTDEEHEIDVLAVSGLGSHAFGSFMNKEDGNMWLADNLQQDLPTARVMIYGYESGLQNSTSFVQLDDLANPLQIDISRLLRSEKSKPLLLIGHSLGGLLVKEALIRMSEDHLDMVFGILLFGAPNDGMDIESLIPMVNDQPNRLLLESLNPNSQILRRQKEGFSRVLDRAKCQLFCFYETELSPTAAQDPETGKYKMTGPRRCLVSQPSATSCLPAGISSDHSVAVRRTHSDMIKFSFRDDEYDRVVDIIRRIQDLSTFQLHAGDGDSDLDGQPTQKETKFPKQLLISRLYFDKIGERLTHLTSALVKTCSWFLKTPEYLSWQDASQQPVHGGLLWIKGNPGTGKSTLMKFLFEETKSNTEHDTSSFTLSFFFLARGTVEEKTTKGLYRSLLHQLFNMAPDLQESLEWLTADGAEVIHRAGWHEEALKQTLKHAVQKLGEKSLTIFVDALDECDEKQVAGMVFFFEELCECATDANLCLKICFSSRHYPTVLVQKGMELVLEDETGHKEDLQRYIKARLKFGKSKQAESLQSELLEKSSGIFLWVVLVVQIVNAQYPNSISKVREHLKKIPPKLNDLFRMILHRDGDNIEQLQLCLKWILFAIRPLKPQELYFAIQIGCEKTCSGYWDQEDIDLNNMKAFVRSSSKGLAEVTRSEAGDVQFIHESVRDFLLGKYESQWSGTSGNFIGHSHEILRNCCSAQLVASIPQDKDGPTSLPLASKEAQSPDNISLMFPFLEYALHNIFQHATWAQKHGLDQRPFLASFPLQQWVSNNNAVEQYDSRIYTNSVSLLYILAERNLADLIDIHPRKKSCFNVEAEHYGAPVLAALANSSRDAVCAILKAQAETEPSSSPFHWLYHKYSSLDAPKSTGFGPDFQFSRRRGISSHLSEQGDEAIVFAFFLASPGFDINWTDSDNRTPLSWAAGNGHEEVVNLLLNKGAYIESRDMRSRTPLWWAVDKGQEAIVELLLEKGANYESRDLYLRTPLSWAVEKGHEGVVTMLLVKGAGIESRDRSKRTPLLWAVEKGHEAIVRLLLKSGANIDAGDADGRTPLALATTCEHESIAKFLIDEGASLKPKDQSTSSPPSLNAKEQREQTAGKSLLRTGDGNEIKSRHSRTPLWWAERMGSKTTSGPLQTKHYGGLSGIISRPYIYATGLFHKQNIYRSRS